MLPRILLNIAVTLGRRLFGCHLLDRLYLDRLYLDRRLDRILEVVPFGVVSPGQVVSWFGGLIGCYRPPITARDAR